MRDPDDDLEGEDDGEDDREDETAEEDLIALHAIAALLEVDGDPSGLSELAWAHREALAAVSDEALALKSRREKRERREAAERRAQAHARAERRERAQRQEEARRKAQRRPQVEERRPVPARPSPTVAASRPVTRVDRPSPLAVVPRPVVAAPVVARQEDTAEQRPAPVVASKEPDRFLQTKGALLTGADLTGWRSRLGLTQQGAADRLGVRQGTVSKAESKRGAARRWGRRCTTR